MRWDSRGVQEKIPEGMTYEMVILNKGGGVRKISGKVQYIYKVIY